LIILIYFIIIALIISYIDAKKEIIPDRIILPAILGLLILKYFSGNLLISDCIAVGVVLFIFIIPIILNFAFGGGDLRFGAFCALFLGLSSIGWFIMFSGIIHLSLLGILKKRTFGFAPAMSIAAMLSYFIGKM